VYQSILRVHNEECESDEKLKELMWIKNKQMNEDINNE